MSCVSTPWRCWHLGAPDACSLSHPSIHPSQRGWILLLYSIPPSSIPASQHRVDAWMDRTQTGAAVSAVLFQYPADAAAAAADAAAALVSTYGPVTLVHMASVGSMLNTVQPQPRHTGGRALPSRLPPSLNHGNFPTGDMAMRLFKFLIKLFNSWDFFVSYVVRVGTTKRCPLDVAITWG